MISKIKQFSDKDMNRQIDEIVSSQFANYKEITVTFTAADTTTKADIGFKVDRYFPISKTADVSIWHSEESDDRYLYLQASGAATVIMKVWRNKEG